MSRSLSFSLTALLIALGLAAGSAAVARAEPPGALAGIKAARGTSLNAGFTNYTPTIGTYVQIIAGEQIVQFDDALPYKQSLYIFLGQWSLSSGENLIYADCQGQADVWRVAPNLSDASLRGAAVCVNHITNSTFDVSVNLTATATSELERFTQQSQFFDSGLIFAYHTSGAARTAAACGVISDGIQNFTPNPSYFGYLVRSEEGLIVVQPPGLSH
jgi:hypothetical protein